MRLLGVYAGVAAIGLMAASSAHALEVDTFSLTFNSLPQDQQQDPVNNVSGISISGTLTATLVGGAWNQDGMYILTGFSSLSYSDGSQDLVSAPFTVGASPIPVTYPVTPGQQNAFGSSANDTASQLTYDQAITTTWDQVNGDQPVGAIDNNGILFYDTNSVGWELFSIGGGEFAFQDDNGDTSDGTLTLTDTTPNPNPPYTPPPPPPGVPEPFSIALLGSALAGFGVLRRRRA